MKTNKKANLMMEEYQMLDGIQNFLTFINNNWTALTVIIALVIAIYRKAKVFFSKSNDEKIAAAKVQIKESMLKWITDAEVDYETWKSAGSIKRSQVIQKIFAEYPILSRVTDQESLVAWIDDTIDDALKSLRKIMAEQPETEETSVK